MLPLRKIILFLRLAIDDPIDFEVINDVARMPPNIVSFGVNDVIKLHKKNKNIF